MQKDLQMLAWSKRLPIDRYLLPRSLREALEMVQDAAGKAKVMAGGTDVLVGLRRGAFPQSTIIDISRISGLDYIAVEDGWVRLGALVTHRQVVECEPLRRVGRALCVGARAVGSPQIRTMGTVVGNILSAQPAADATIPLMALDAELQAVSPDGERTIPIRELFLDTGKTALNTDREIVTEVRFRPLGSEEGSAFLRLAKRRSLALPILNAAVVVGADLEKRHFRYVRIALGPVAPTPFRPLESEALFRGAPLDERIITQAAEKASHEAQPRTNPLRGSADYRKELIRTFVRRGVHRAMAEIEDRK